jgi:hypothetical protein
MTTKEATMKTTESEEELSLREYARQVAETAPPLTQDQVAVVRANLLGGHRLSMSRSRKAA